MLTGLNDRFGGPVVLVTLNPKPLKIMEASLEDSPCQPRATSQRDSFLINLSQGVKV